MNSCTIKSTPCQAKKKHQHQHQRNTNLKSSLFTPSSPSPTYPPTPPPSLDQICSASAFVPSASFVGSRVASVSRPASSTPVSMAASDMVGASAPLGFFDPMGFSKGPAERLNAYRESELKHGRTAMLAVVGFLTQVRWLFMFSCFVFGWRMLVVVVAVRLSRLRLV